MKVLGALALVLAGTALAAELTGTRAAVYAGSAGGSLMGLAGYAVARMIAARHKAEQETQQKQMGKKDIWSLWIVGLLVRLAMLGLFAGALILLLPETWRTGLMTLAAVYLLLMFAETWWLMSQIVDTKQTGS